MTDVQADIDCAVRPYLDGFVVAVEAEGGDDGAVVGAQALLVLIAGASTFQQSKLWLSRCHVVTLSSYPPQEVIRLSWTVVMSGGGGGGGGG